MMNIWLSYVWPIMGFTGDKWVHTLIGFIHWSVLRLVSSHWRHWWVYDFYTYYKEYQRSSQASSYIARNTIYEGYRRKGQSLADNGGLTQHCYFWKQIATTVRLLDFATFLEAIHFLVYSYYQVLPYLIIIFCIIHIEYCFQFGCQTDHRELK